MKPVDILKDLYKGVIDYFYGVIVAVHVPEYDLQAIAIVAFIERLLVPGPVFYTSVDNVF
jgi:hypothetical protein